MNRCREYDIPCPHALDPYRQEKCDCPDKKLCGEWRVDYQKNITDKFTPHEVAEIEKLLIEGGK